MQNWIGKTPVMCDLCGHALKKADYFVDGRTVYGGWALLCPLCHMTHGKGLGMGAGQKYSAKPPHKKLEG